MHREWWPNARLQPGVALRRARAAPLHRFGACSTCSCRSPCWCGLNMRHPTCAQVVNTPLAHSEVACQGLLERSVLAVAWGEQLASSAAGWLSVNYDALPGLNTRMHVAVTRFACSFKLQLLVI